MNAVNPHHPPRDRQGSSQAINESPLVSVIIPNYNHARYLPQAIDSVLAQDYPHYEIIVVDDGSTDDSRTVAARYQDRIEYIWQKNRGLSAARNTGLQTARGDLIGLLDADDLYEPDFLSTMVDILQTAPEFEAVYCGYQFVDEQNRALFQQETRAIPPAQLYPALIEGNFLVPESMLARRHCYEAVGPFDESLRACEDWDIWLKMARRFPITGTTRLLTRHRILPGSMSSDPIRMLNNRLTVIASHFGPEPADPATATPEQRRAYSRAYLTTAIEYLQYHDTDRAVTCLQKMAATEPDLLQDPATFYELGCGDQPKGSRGDFSTLDISKNGALLFYVLNQVLADDRLASYRQSALAQANLALGRLSYGARQMSTARRFLLRAIAADVRVGLTRQTGLTLLKATAGAFIPRQPTN